MQKCKNLMRVNKYSDTVFEMRMRDTGGAGPALCQRCNTSSLTSSSGGVGLVATEGSLFVRRFTADRRKTPTNWNGGFRFNTKVRGKKKKSLPCNVSRRNRYENFAGN